MTVAARMHHYEWVTEDSEATRRFYEDVVGIPLVCVWTEQVDMGDRIVPYLNAHYGLADGSVLSFFTFSEPDDRRAFAATPSMSPFVKIALDVDAATQDEIEKRLASDPSAETETFRLDHGYCRSLYTRDPNGLVLEFTVDTSDVQVDANAKREQARADLDRWVAGDHTSNNRLRPG